MPSKTSIIKHTTVLATYLLIVWGLYRYLFKLPDEIEQLFIKPIFWLIPVFYLVRKERAKLVSLGITFKNFFPSLYLALALGVFFAIEGMIVNFVKYGGFNFGANVGQQALLVSLGLSFATAISEEVTFRGYIFNRLWGALGNEWTANLVTSFVWSLIHLPITIFVWNLDMSGILIYLVLTFLFGVGSAFVFARTKNVFSSIFLHVFWEWPIVLFR